MYPMPENPATYCAAHHLRPQLNPFEFIHDIRTDGITGVMQLAMNVVFFLPLGYFMKRVFRWKFGTALPAMFLTSLLIVFFQKGAIQISTSLGLNDSFADIITGIIIFFIIGSEFFINYSVKFRSKEAKA